MLCVYIAFKERDTFKKTWQHKGTTTAVSICSRLGSIAGLAPVSLQHVAYGKNDWGNRGIFTIVVSILWLKQPLKRQDTAGLVVNCLVAILVMLPN